MEVKVCYLAFTKENLLLFILTNNVNLYITCLVLEIISMIY